LERAVPICVTKLVDLFLSLLPVFRVVPQRRLLTPPLPPEVVTVIDGGRIYPRCSEHSLPFFKAFRKDFVRLPPNLPECRILVCLGDYPGFACVDPFSFISQSPPFCCSIISCLPPIDGEKSGTFPDSKRFPVSFSFALFCPPLFLGFAPRWCVCLHSASIRMHSSRKRRCSFSRVLVTARQEVLRNRQIPHLSLAKRPTSV